MGAVGGHLAARLHAGGAEVSAVARGANLQALRSGPLRVEWPGGTLSAPVRASADPGELGPQDHVIVAVKAPSLPSVAAAIGPLLGPDTAVTFVMNGVPWWYFDGTAEDGRTLPAIDPGDALRRALGPGRTIGATILSSCTVVEPGFVRVENKVSRITLGEPGGAVTPRVEALAAVLRQDGLAADVTERIRDPVWAKLVINMCNGPLGVLSGSANRDVYADPACCEALRRTAAEGMATAAAMGVDARVDADALIGQFKSSAHKSSIVQDLEGGRPMEVDAIYVVPLEFAREKGVATPTLDLLVALVKLRARAAGLY